MGDKDRGSSNMAVLYGPGNREREIWAAVIIVGTAAAWLSILSSWPHLTSITVRRGRVSNKTHRRGDRGRERGRGLIGSPWLQTALTTQASICFPESTEATRWSKIRVDVGRVGGESPNSSSYTLIVNIREGVYMKPKVTNRPGSSGLSLLFLEYYMVKISLDVAVH